MNEKSGDSDFFSQLTPEHFNMATSASDERSIPSAAASMDPKARFELFRKEMEAHALYHHDPRVFCITAFIENSETRRRFEGEPDENVQHFINRLQREAKEMDAWVYSVHMHSPGALPGDADISDVDKRNGKAVQKAYEEGRTRLLYICVSQSRQNSHIKAWRVSNQDGTLENLNGIDAPGAVVEVFKDVLS